MVYDYEYFKKEIYSLTTIDLNAYKEKQMNSTLRQEPEGLECGMFHGR